MTGIGEEDLGSVRYMDLVHPDDRGPMSKLWARARVPGEPFEMEYRLLGPDGRVTWVSGRATAVRGADGEPAGYFGAALTSPRAGWWRPSCGCRARSPQNMAEGVVLVRHSDDKIVWANRRFADIFGYERRRARGHGREPDQRPRRRRPGRRDRGDPERGRRVRVLDGRHPQRPQGRHRLLEPRDRVRVRPPRARARCPCRCRRTSPSASAPTTSCATSGRCSPSPSRSAVWAAGSGTSTATR